MLLSFYSEWKRRYLVGDAVKLLDGQKGFAEVVKLDGDAVLRQDAVFVHFYWDPLGLKDFVQVSLELFAAAAPGEASKGNCGLAIPLLELNVSEVFVVETV